MGAARKQRYQNHQIRGSKEPLVGLQTRCFRCSRDKSQMAAFGEIPQVLQADACERGDFRICKDFLT